MGNTLPLVPGDGSSGNVLIVGTTTSNGASDGTTAIDSNAGQTDGYYVGGIFAILNSPDSSIIGEQREITGYISSTGEYTFDPGFTAMVPTATQYVVYAGTPSGGGAGPFVAVTGYIDAGSTTTMLRDAARTESDDFWNGALVIMESGPDKYQARWIWDFVQATGDLYLQNALSALPIAGSQYVIVSFNSLSAAANDTSGALFQGVIGNKADTTVTTIGTTASILAYLKGVLSWLLVPSADAVTNASLRDVVGNKTDAAVTTVGTTASLVAYIKGLLSGLAGTATDFTVGPSNFFAGYITLVSVTTATSKNVSGFYVDVNGFTDGALLTARVTIKIGAGNAQRSFTNSFYKDSTTSNTLFPVIDSGVPVKGVAASIVVELTSNNAADTAVTAPGTYFI